jgi:hypothetical protein
MNKKSNLKNKSKLIVPKKNKSSESDCFLKKLDFLFTEKVILAIYLFFSFFYVSLLFVFSGVNFNSIYLTQFLVFGGIIYFFIVFMVALSNAIIFTNIRKIQYLGLFFWISSLLFFSIVLIGLNPNSLINRYSLTPFILVLISMFNICVNLYKINLLIKKENNY